VFFFLIYCKNISLFLFLDVEEVERLSISYPGNKPPSYKPSGYNAKPPSYNDKPNYSGGANYASGYDDPHFMISSESQPAICFDFKPEADVEFTLLADGSTGLLIEAHSSLKLKHETHKHIIMDEIKFTSPLGRVIAFDLDGVHLFGSEENASDRHPFTGVQTFGDISFVTHTDPHGNHQRTHVEVGDAVFMVRGNARKESMAVAVVEPTGLSQESTGIIGQFLRENAYAVDETDNLHAFVNVAGQRIEAEKKKFHQQLSCWVVDEEAMLNIINKN